MPELPEVEIVCRNLSEMIKPGEKIRGWTFFREDLRFKIPKAGLHKLIGQPILNIKRRAKYILFDFGEFTLVSHLGMTGSWRQESKKWTRLKHDHLIFELSEARFFVYADPRRFGFVEVVRSKELSQRFKDLGVEPLSDETDFAKLSARFRALNSPIKSALMNQKLVVGIGNIYASEALFAAGVSPLKSCAQITQSQYLKIWQNVKRILHKSIVRGGSSIENYRNGYGEKGDFQNEFFVYGRAGEKCKHCGTLIKSKVLSGRSSFWCSSCQK